MKKNYIITFCLFILLTNYLIGQVAGDLSTSNQNITFNKTFNGLTLDPNPNIGFNTQRRIVRSIGDLNNPNNFGNEIGASILADLLAEVGINVPSKVFDIVNGAGGFFGASVSPTFNAGFRADYGGYVEVDDIGDANIEVDYPVQVSITYPEQNTFACGDEFTIQTSYVVLEKDDMLKVTPPFMEMELGPFLDNLRFEVGFGLKASACFGLPNPFSNDCPGIPFSFDKSFTVINQNINLPDFLENGVPVVTVCEESFGEGNSEADLIACTTGGLSILQLARQAIDVTGGIGTNAATFASFPTDNRIEVFTPPIPEPPLPEINGQFNRITNDVLNFSSLSNGRKLRVNGTQNDVSKLEFDLISLLDLAKIPTSIEYGTIFELDFGDLSPTFSIDQELNYEFDPRVNLTIQLGVPMAYRVIDDVLGEVSSGFGSEVNLIAGQRIVATYPEALSDPTNVDGNYVLDGEFKTLTNARYYNSTTINIGQLSVGGFEASIFSDEIGKGEDANSPVKIQDHKFNLTGFEPIQLNNFSLDPENPIINIQNVTVEDIVNIGGGEREVVYKIVIVNDGDVELRNTLVDFNLQEAFSTASNLEVRCVYSDDLNVNSNYDGINNINLLQNGNTILVGQESSIELLVRVKPEIAEIDSQGCFEPVEYFISAFASATSPIGTAVQNNFYQCTGERTAEDIVTSVDLGAAIIESLSDYTIYGWKDVVFDKELEKSYGNVGSSSSIRFENISQKTKEYSTIVGDLHAGNEVFLQGESKLIVDYIQVANDVKIPNRKSILNETGRVSSFSDCAVIFDEIQLEKVNFSGNKKTIESGEVYVLQPGSYKEIRLQKNATLKMSSGVYNIGTWAFMDDNINVLYDTRNGPLEINIGKWQYLGGAENIELKLENDGSQREIIYKYTGNQPTKFNNSFVQGQIYAPNAEVEFSLGSILEGSCYAEKVNFKTGSYFIGNDFLDELNLNPNCLNSNTIETIVQNFYSSDAGSNALTDVVIFPNPVGSSITIKSETYISKLEIVNAMGQQVYNIDNLKFKEKTIGLQSIANGMYFIRIKTEKEMKVLKFLKN